MSIVLNDPKVAFDQKAHTYTDIATGEVLQGITGTVLRMLFPDKYRGIPQSVLDKAAARGTLIHEECELFSAINLTPTTPEARAYADMCASEDIEVLATEYSVCGMGFATNIDAVWRTNDDAMVDLVDIKTTRQLDKEYVSWQLSICAEMFETCNPHLTVRCLYAAWLQGEVCSVISVPRKDTLAVQEACACARSSKVYATRIEAWREDLDTIAARIRILTDEIQQKQQDLDECKGFVMAVLNEHGVDNVDLGSIKMTLTSGATSKRFDTTKFRHDHADLFAQYLKESISKPSLRITIRELDSNSTQPQASE